jgi:TRAP-type C4-dicarboxylate transport system permease small subunit
MSHNSQAGRAGLLPDLERRVGYLVGWIAQLLAIAGGIVLIAIVVLVVLSVSGRALLQFGLGPIPGDFELVEAGSAFAAFSFLAWCQYRRGHVTVDLFVQRFGPRGLAVLSFAGNILMTLAALFIAWRLGLGLQDKKLFRETTFILQIPLWWSYAASLVGAWAFALVSLYTVWRSLNEALGAGEPVTVGLEGGEIGE